MMRMQMVQRRGWLWVMGLAAAGLGAAVGACGSRQPAAIQAATEAAPRAPERPDPSVSLLSYRVHGPQWKDAMTKLAGYYGPPSDREGMQTLVLDVSTEKDAIVGVDRAVIEEYSDNTGADLTAGASQATHRLFFPIDSNVTLDKRHGFLKLTFPKGPTPGATSMRLKGSLILRCGVGETTMDFSNVAFAEGSKIDVKGNVFTLSRIWRDNSDTSGTTNYYFTSSQSYDAIRAMRFVSEDGTKEIGHIRRIDRDFRGTSVLCWLQERPGSLRVQVDTYDAIEQQSIPFDIEVNIGATGTEGPRKVVAEARPTTATSRPGVTARVISLGFQRQISKEEASAWFGREAFGFRDEGGTGMELLLESPDRPMAQITPNPLSIRTFCDDLGGDMLADAEMRVGNGGGDVRVVSPDGKLAVLEVMSKGVPAPGARYIHFQGTVAVIYAGSEKTWETKGVALEPGSFSVGPKTFRIESVSTTFPGRGMHVYLTSDKLEDVKSVEFADEAGKSLNKVAMRGRSSSDTWVSATLPAIREKATVRVVGFDEATSETVPLDVTVPIGLGGGTP